MDLIAIAEGVLCCVAIVAAKVPWATGTGLGTKRHRQESAEVDYPEQSSRPESNELTCPDSKLDEPWIGL